MKKTVILLLMTVVFGFNFAQAACTVGTGPIISDFKVRNIGDNNIEMIWTAPSGQNGVASYDIRYRAIVGGVGTALSSRSWSTATKITGTTTPKQAGYAESLVMVMPVGTSLYFGIAATDGCGNVGPMSNVSQVNNPLTPTASNIISIDGSTSIPQAGAVIKTVYLNTNGFSGGTFYVIYDMAKVAITNIQPSGKTGAIQGYIAANLNAVSSAGMQSHTFKRLVAHETAGKKTAIVVIATTDVYTGLIPLFDVTLTGAAPGTTNLLVVPEEANVLSTGTANYLPEVYPYPNLLTIPLTVL